MKKKLTRRDCLQTTLAAAAAAGALSALPARAGVGPLRKKPAGKPHILLSEIFSPNEHSRLRLAKQIGINNIILSANSTLRQVRREQYYEALVKVKSELKDKGLGIAGVESHPVPAEKIKLGLDGRDEEIENYKAAIEALSRAGIKMICYNFMAGLGWYRTRKDVPERGGALVSEFNNEAATAEGLTQWGEVSEAKMWSNIEYFLKAVMPVADKHGVQMALHPDDPPLSPLRGIGRIVTSARNYRRIMDIVPSPLNGITFCQANFVAMGEDIEALGKEWCRQKKVFFVHYRDIEGKGPRFRETFHDNGPTDMARILRVYADSGFEGPIRPDHAPMLEGESNDRPGYGMAGKVFAIGYMKGILDAYGIAHA